MEFKDLLNGYIDQLEISAKELSNASGVDAALISRYRSGKRLPSKDSETLLSLVKGVESIAKEKNIEISKDILLSFNNAIQIELDKPTIFSKHFVEMIDEYHINIKKLAKYLNYDVSYLYRIKSGERKPHDLNLFVSQFVQYLLENINHDLLKEYTGANDQPLESYLCYWLINDVKEDDSKVMLPFLNKLDEFDLDDYMKVIHFDELKIPKIPFQLPTSKYYYGIKDMRNAELDFFKYTVLNKSNNDIFMYSTMPMEEMAEDMDFNKKWMFGIAMSIKKGLHINIIHHLDRPFEELMLGLQAWIPIYMTGQVNPYYIPNFNTDIFHSLDYASGNIMLHGECVDGHYLDGRYYLSTNKQDVTYANKKANALLHNAKPLMSIYDTNKSESFKKFLEDFLKEDQKSRFDLSSSLPIGSMCEALLLTILDRNQVKEEDKKKILDYYHECKDSFYKSMSNGLDYKIAFSMPNKNDYDKHPYYLDISALFLDYTISYTYDELEAHYNDIKSHMNASFRIVDNEDFAYRNITLKVINQEYVIVSKIKSPVIHFVIQHPTLVDAINNMVTAKKE